MAVKCSQENVTRRYLTLYTGMKDLWKMLYVGIKDLRKFISFSILLLHSQTCSLQLYFNPLLIPNHYNNSIPIFCICFSDDIQVRFYEESDEELIWESFADFGACDVHRQVTMIRYCLLVLWMQCSSVLIARIYVDQISLILNKCRDLLILQCFFMMAFMEIRCLISFIRYEFL